MVQKMVQPSIVTNERVLRAAAQAMVAAFLEQFNIPTPEAALPVLQQVSAGIQLTAAPGGPGELKVSVQTAIGNQTSITIIPGLNDRFGSGVEDYCGMGQAKTVVIPGWVGTEAFATLECVRERPDNVKMKGKKRKRREPGWWISLYQIVFPVERLVQNNAQLQSNEDRLKAAYAQLEKLSIEMKKQGEEEEEKKHKQKQKKRKRRSASDDDNAEAGNSAVHAIQGEIEQLTGEIEQLVDGLQPHLPVTQDVVRPMLAYCNVVHLIDAGQVAAAASHMSWSWQARRTKSKGSGFWVLSHMNALGVFKTNDKDAVGATLGSSSSMPSTSLSGLPPHQAGTMSRQRSTAGFPQLPAPVPANLPELVSAALTAAQQQQQQMLTQQALLHAPQAAAPGPLGQQVMLGLPGYQASLQMNPAAANVIPSIMINMPPAGSQPLAHNQPPRMFGTTDLAMPQTHSMLSTGWQAAPSMPYARAGLHTQFSMAPTLLQDLFPNAQYQQQQPALSLPVNIPPAQYAAGMSMGRPFGGDLGSAVPGRLPADGTAVPQRLMGRAVQSSYGMVPYAAPTAPHQGSFPFVGGLSQAFDPTFGSMPGSQQQAFMPSLTPGSVPQQALIQPAPFDMLHITQTTQHTQTPTRAPVPYLRDVSGVVARAAGLAEGLLTAGEEPQMHPQLVGSSSSSMAVFPTMSAQGMPADAHMALQHSTSTAAAAAAGPVLGTQPIEQQAGSPTGILQESNEAEFDLSDILNELV